MCSSAASFRVWTRCSRRGPSARAGRGRPGRSRARPHRSSTSRIECTYRQAACPRSPSNSLSTKTCSTLTPRLRQSGLWLGASRSMAESDRSRASSHSPSATVPKPRRSCSALLLDRVPGGAATGFARAGGLHLEFGSSRAFSTSSGQSRISRYQAVRRQNQQARDRSCPRASSGRIATGRHDPMTARSRRSRRDT